MKYVVTTDAVTMTIEASDPDEAAARFAASEPHYSRLNIKTASELSEAADEAGGWASIILIS